MSKNKIEGQCKLCKNHGLLTFEHVPPRTAFNDKRVKVVSGSELFDHVVSDRNPWELSQLYGRIQQKGKGGYYLCKDCNANAGSWYVPYYEEFIKGICSACSQESYEKREAVLIETGSFSPLPIIKQVLLMFLDINNIGFGDDELRDFIINKEKKTGFNSNKYKVYCFIVRGSVERLCGFSVYMIDTRSEIQLLGVT
ncbi:MAG: hypothetical protein IJS45_00035 [Clostridia bacterium]|nr:hypothetical protein [Clostridia bacterium]